MNNPVGAADWLTQSKFEIEVDALASRARAPSNDSTTPRDFPFFISTCPRLALEDSSTSGLLPIGDRFVKSETAEFSFSIS
ncbi:hypothetical protein [Caballeronia terrestris]|uniref:hypothetical protein n=1 Tax=Caballeronia terrestris TaxID=1226301 RepID=UPI000F74508F|nr:hypothetical protein [Caballeronia terrestris]